MRHSSKFYLVIPILLLIMGLAACSSEATPPPPEPTATVEPPAATEADEKKIRLVTAATPGTPLFQITELVLSEAFKRNGYEATIEFCPAKRCIQIVESGEADGDAIRIYDFVKDGAHPSHFRVEESFTSTRWVAVATNPDIKVSGWADLKTNNYRVGYLAGTSRAERNLIGVIDDDKLFVVSTGHEEGFNMLLADRFDVYVTSKTGLIVLQTEQFKDSGIRNIGLLEENFLYAYLHVKHKELAPQIAETIKEMKAEGLLEQYNQQLLAEDAAQ